MEKKKDFDVVVVGAGPGGASAAYFLSKGGLKTCLIDKSTFPRDKSCGDGLTRMSARLARELGILPQLSHFRSIAGVRVHVEGKGARDFLYPEELEEPHFGFVVPRYLLDHLLLAKALEAGAIHREGTAVEELLYSETKKVSGVLLKSGETVTASLVIAADGAASRLAYQAGLPLTPKEAIGFGLRGYYSGIGELTHLLEIFMPVLDATGKYVLPSYGWVFPLGDGRANIGVGLTSRLRHENVQAVMGRFVERLRQRDPRFADMQLDGRWLGAPMRFDFTPSRSFAPGLLLVGDAAGLISPFTGEGIGYAMESGRLAAETALERRAAGSDLNDLSSYGQKLSRRYQGYFEAGTEAGKKYQFVWRALKHTFDNERPLFATLRQATLFPEGVGESFFKFYCEDVSPIIYAARSEIRTDMLAVGENLIELTRKDWPFLSRLLSPPQITPGIPFRPGLFVLLGGYASTPRRPALVTLATALELGYAAGLCHDSVENADGESSTWGNRLALLAGDFLLTQAYGQAVQLPPRYVTEIAETLGRSQQAQVQGEGWMDTPLTPAGYVQWLYRKNEPLFELCIYLGSLLSGGSMEKSIILRRFGKYFGVAYQLVDEILSEKQRGKHLHKMTHLEGADGSPVTLPQLLREAAGSARAPDEDTVPLLCFKTAAAEMKKASFALLELPDSPVKKTLSAMADFFLQKAEAAVASDKITQTPLR